MSTRFFRPDGSKSRNTSNLCQVCSSATPCPTTIRQGTIWCRTPVVRHGVPDLPDWVEELNDPKDAGCCSGGGIGLGAGRRRCRGEVRTSRKRRGSASRSASTRPRTALIVPVQLGGKSYRFILDTGCTGTIFGRTFRAQLGSPIDHSVFGLAVGKARSRSLRSPRGNDRHASTASGRKGRVLGLDVASRGLGIRY